MSDKTPFFILSGIKHPTSVCFPCQTHSANLETMASPITQGLVFVFTGEGKGKTSAALGMAIRAAGRGMGVLILQFMKGRSDLGELYALDKANLPITFMQFGRPGFVQSRVCEPLDIYIAQQGLKTLREAIGKRSYDMIILDEINTAVDFGLLKIDEVISAVKERLSGLHMVLTGRYACKNLIEIADLVTEMKEVKHHYHQGIKAQEGIEF